MKTICFRLSIVSLTLFKGGQCQISEVRKCPFCAQVIKTLDPKQPVTATPEIQALKNQLTEKERKIQHLEVSVFCLDDKKNSGHCGSLNLTNAWWSVPAAQHDYEKSRARHDQEEKLIISAWYNMVSECRHVLEGTSVLYWGFHVSSTTENHLVHRVLLRPNKDPYWTRQKFLFCILYILFYAHTWSITPSLSVCLSLRGWRCIRRFLASG